MTKAEIVNRVKELSGLNATQAQAAEIGRASCRERV